MFGEGVSLPRLQSSLPAHKNTSGSKFRDFISFLYYYLFDGQGKQELTDVVSESRINQKTAPSIQTEPIKNGKQDNFIDVRQIQPKREPHPISSLMNVTLQYRNGNFTSALAETSYSLQKNDRRLKGLVFRKIIQGRVEKWSVYEEAVIQDIDRFTVTLVVVSTYDLVCIARWLIL